MAKKRIMIVDPSMYSRMVLSGILQSHGYSVCCEVSDPDEAVKCYDKTRPDVVLVEAQMPGKDGVAVIRELCREFEGCQALLCAASGQRGDVCAALGAGAVDFLAKPYSERAVVRTLLRLSSRQRAA